MMWTGIGGVTGGWDFFRILFCGKTEGVWDCFLAFVPWFMRNIERLAVPVAREKGG